MTNQTTIQAEDTKQTFLCGCGHIHKHRTGGCRISPSPSYTPRWNSEDPIQWALMMQDSDALDNLERNMQTDAERETVLRLKNEFATNYGFVHRLTL